jgi:hypothetical protein
MARTISREAENIICHLGAAQRPRDGIYLPE